MAASRTPRVRQRIARLAAAAWRVAAAADERTHRRSRPGPTPGIRVAQEGSTAVDEYWGGHTVMADLYRTTGASEKQLAWRFAQYPLFREFSGLWGDHDGEVVLDYGCGPGNDVTGFALYTRAARIVGMDVSRRALELAARRLALHRIDPVRIDLCQLGDAHPVVPLDDGCIDFLQSMGVLHHVSDPLPILRELHRVLRVGGRASVMVYNRDSVWLHLYTAYERMIVEGAFRGLAVEEAFAHNTDGEECPISRCYTSGDWTSLCEEAGFEVEYLGGYLSRRELQSMRESWAAAVVDQRLGAEHREFLRGLVPDPAGGLPTHAGRHAGIGGSYRLRRV